MRHTCGEPDRSDRKYTNFPSGENAGELSFSWRAVSRCVPLPSVAATQMSLCIVLFSTSDDRNVYAMSFPSRDNVGSPTRSIASMSSMPNG